MQELTQEEKIIMGLHPESNHQTLTGTEFNTGPQNQNPEPNNNIGITDVPKQKKGKPIKKLMLAFGMFSILAFSFFAGKTASEEYSANMVLNGNMNKADQNATKELVQIEINKLKEEVNSPSSENAKSVNEEIEQLKKEVLESKKNYADLEDKLKQLDRIEQRIVSVGQKSIKLENQFLEITGKEIESEVEAEVESEVETEIEAEVEIETETETETEVETEVEIEENISEEKIVEDKTTETE